MTLTPPEAIRAAQAALDGMDGIINQLNDAVQDAGLFTPAATINAGEAQINTLMDIQLEIGPRLIERIRAGEYNKFEDLKKLIENATTASREIARMLDTELTVGAALTYVTTQTIEGVKQAAADTVKQAAPVGLLLAGVALLIFLKK